MADTSDTDSQTDDDNREDVEQRQRELDAILATKLSWSHNVDLLVQPDEALPSSTSRAPNEEDDLATTAFPLFGTNNHVRLLSPSLIYTGPGKGRILEEAEEPRSVRKERKKRIAECAVDADWIMERSNAQYWTPHPHDAGKLEKRALVPRRPLPKTVLGLIKPSGVWRRAAPAQPGAATSSTVLTRPTPELRRVKITPYPAAQKIRLAKKVTKERFATPRKPKRKSKKRRDFEKAGKGKELPGLGVKSKG